LEVTDMASNVHGKRFTGKPGKSRRLGAAALACALTLLFILFTATGVYASRVRGAISGSGDQPAKPPAAAKGAVENSLAELDYDPAGASFALAENVPEGAASQSGGAAQADAAAKTGGAADNAAAGAAADGGAAANAAAEAELGAPAGQEKPAAAVRKIDPSKPMIALTFDDGPSKHTKTILAMLAANGGAATFFPVGSRVETYADTLRQAVSQGCEVSGHSWDHANLTKLSSDSIKKQLNRTNDAVFAATGRRSSLYRPPYGSHNSSVRAASKEAGYSLILWSVDPRDWQKRNATTVARAILNDAKDGSIVVCHDIYESTAVAMKEVIPALVAKGYQIVTVSELLGFASKPPTPGEAYYKK
jgi:peptidoglycan/xylan/chitin deacetylase (PgdA/CDA1 family)